MPKDKGEGESGEGNGSLPELPPIVLMGHGMGAQKVAGDGLC